MFLRLFKIALVMTLLVSFPAYSQTQDDAQKQREEFEKNVQEELTKRINAFVSELSVDDFQKEIIKQKLHSYYKEQRLIYTNNELKYFERDELVTNLNNTHFEDINNMLSEDTKDQIQLFIKDVGTTLEKEKKKKKKNKKKKDE